MNRRYTEKDIARLERGDLTDPAVCSELLHAYCRNDRTTDERLTLKRDLDVFVPEEGLRQLLAHLEAVENPSAETRADRLHVLSRLAVVRKEHEGQAAEQTQPGYKISIDRDRGAPHGAAPPTPPGIRVTYHGGSPGLSLSRGVESGEAERVEIAVAKGLLDRHMSGHAPARRRRAGGDGRLER